MRRVSEINIDGFKEEYKDNLSGGVADTMSPEDFDKASLDKGIKVELEHTDDPMLAMEIAMDHLAEYSDYYDALEDMEKELDKESQVAQDINADVEEIITDILSGQDCLDIDEKDEYLEDELDVYKYVVANIKDWLPELFGYIEGEGSGLDYEFATSSKHLIEVSEGEVEFEESGDEYTKVSSGSYASYIDGSVYLLVFSDEGIGSDEDPCIVVDFNFEDSKYYSDDHTASMDMRICIDDVYIDRVGNYDF